MMLDMPRPRPQHLHHERTRHGKLVWFVRIGHGPRTRIRSDFGTPEFNAEYKSALAGTATPKSTNNTGTLAWLVARYRETNAWTSLVLETRQRRENILLAVLESAGQEPYTAITKAVIVAGRERRTPTQAKHFLDAIRGLFKWAADAGLVEVDPTAGVAYPKLADSDGFPHGMRKTLRAMKASGQSGPVKGFGWTFFYTLVCAEVMLHVSGSNTSGAA